jgi:hypothetical protein
MSRQYFGTDGIRGTVGKAPITADFALRLGHAVGRVLQRGMQPRGERAPAVLIGKDTRISGYMMESALEAGFASAGVDVVLTGPLPTRHQVLFRQGRKVAGRLGNRRGGGARRAAAVGAVGQPGPRPEAG